MHIISTILVLNCTEITPFLFSKWYVNIFSSGGMEPSIFGVKIIFVCYNKNLKRLNVNSGNEWFIVAWERDTKRKKPVFYRINPLVLQSGPFIWSDCDSISIHAILQITWLWNWHFASFMDIDNHAPFIWWGESFNFLINWSVKYENLCQWIHIAISHCCGKGNSSSALALWHFVKWHPLKALFNNVFTLKNLSYMSLHAISVFDKV